MIQVYTDGSSLWNPWPWWWWVLIDEDSFIVEFSWWVALTTNNRMELFAVIKGLEAILSKEWVIIDQDDDLNIYTDSQWALDWLTILEDRWVNEWLFSPGPSWNNEVINISKAINIERKITHSVTVYTDSSYVQKWITEWIHTRIKRNWRRSKWWKLVQNVDLRIRLWWLLDHFESIDRKWVKWHAWNSMNERVDILARNEAEKF